MPRIIRAPFLALAAVACAAASAHPQTVRPDGTGRDVRICAGGDVTLGTNLDTTWTRTTWAKYGIRAPALPNPDTLLAPIRPLVREADVVLLNIEGAIGVGPARQKCGPRSTQCYAFRSPIAAAGALRRVNTDAEVIGNLANNHARDAGTDAFYQTVRHLREAGVHVTGDDTLATPVVTERGDTVAFLGFSQWTGPDPRNLRAVRRHVSRAAARHRRLVVTMHMGAEGWRAQRTPNRTEMFLGTDRGNSVAFAHTAAAAGADLVVGHGPHVMRAVEWYGGSLIFYSLANLVTYGPFSMGDPLNRGAIACATLDGDGRPHEAVLHSTRQRRPGWVSRDHTDRAAALADSLGRLDFPGTAARITPRGEVLPPRTREPLPRNRIRKDEGK